VWDGDALTQLHRLQCGDDSPLFVFPCPSSGDGNPRIVAGVVTSFVIWDGQTGRLLHAAREDDEVDEIVHSDKAVLYRQGGGFRVAVGDCNGNVSSFDVTRNKKPVCVRRIEGAEGRAAGADELATLPHTDSISCIQAFPPPLEPHVVIGSDDCTAKV
jgi:WD40 repeat protein